jgi:antirestriction protein ArdC
MAQYGSNKALERFAEMMIQKIMEVANDWQKPWFTSRSKGLPQNYSGRIYNRLNLLMLYMQCEKNNYTVPVFMTFNQAKENDVMIHKGEKSFPVIYWTHLVKGITPETERINITYEQYKLLSDEEKTKYRVTSYLKNHNVFNIEQTTFPEKYPEKWTLLKRKFAVLEIEDDKGMFIQPELDRMLEEQSWVCPIKLIAGDQAYHTRGLNDVIVVPPKAQFKDGESFYSTLLHEMAHSTGEIHRLNRGKGGVFGSDKYAKEELVAELTSAICCQFLGISSHIRDENAKYLKSWLNALKEEPKYIFTILTDVNKASQMISETVLEKEKSPEIEQYLHGHEKQTQNQFNKTPVIQDFEFVNQKFDDELKLHIKGILPKGHVYNLGTPSNALLSRLENIAIEMPASRLAIKSSSDYKSNHPFHLNDIHGLPKALANPIAVFEGETDPNRTVVLIELIDKNKNNFIAVIDIHKNKSRQSNEVNSVISIYPKESAAHIAKWFLGKQDKSTGRTLLCWIDKEKASNWLSSNASYVHSAGLSTRSIAKIIKDFENPVILDKKNTQKISPSQHKIDKDFEISI